MKEALELLKQLIAIPSFSKEENGTVDCLFLHLQHKGFSPSRLNNNVWCRNKYFDPEKPFLLLNSHHDTVKPNAAYTLNPFSADIIDGKLFGLGSNDAGGALVALLSTFEHFFEDSDLPFNLIFAATAEEEISGKNGIESLIPVLGNISLAIVGEPTQMKVAVAERGLMVLDATVEGKAGHAARNEGINAIYLAMEDIHWFRNHRFEKVSPYLGPVSMQVTMIQSGMAHNQVPEKCSYVVDIRLNECYTHNELLELIRPHVHAAVQERSQRIKPSFISLSHPMVQSAIELGMECYGSPTTSDMALMPWPAIKVGPGDSARSHSANEYIEIREIEKGIEDYISLLNNYRNKISSVDI